MAGDETGRGTGSFIEIRLSLHAILPRAKKYFRSKRSECGGLAQNALSKTEGVVASTRGTKTSAVSTHGTGSSGPQKIHLRDLILPEYRQETRIAVKESC